MSMNIDSYFIVHIDYRVDIDHKYMLCLVMIKVDSFVNNLLTVNERSGDMECELEVPYIELRRG